MVKCLVFIIAFFVSTSSHAGRDWTKEVVNTDSKLHKEAAQKFREAQEGHTHLETKSHIYGFISFSIPEASLKKLFALQDGDESVTFVLMGFYKDSIKKTQKKILSLLQSDLDKTVYYEVPIIIDPSLFQDYSIETVPQYIKLDDSGQNVASILGDVSPDYFKRKLKEQGEKRFGIDGKLYKIEENNLIDIMMARSEEIDWEYEAEVAHKKSLKQLPKYSFPAATENKSYLKNASIVLQDDIRDSENTILVKKGETVNPFNIMDYPFKDIIFDASDRRQWEIAKALALKSKKSVTFSATDVENILELHEYFGQRVFLLDQRMIDRLDITELPLTAEQHEKDFLISIYKVD